MANFDDRLGAILNNTTMTTEELLDQLEDTESAVVKTLPVACYDKVESKLPAAVTEQLSPDLVDDYEFCRTTLRGVLERGMSALEGALQLAAETESPKAYSTAVELMSLISNTSKDLMGVHGALKQKVGTQKIEKQVNIQQNFSADPSTIQNDPKQISNLLDGLDDEQI